MRMQRINRAGISLPLRCAVPGDRQRRVGGEEPPDDLGFPVAPVMQDDQQAGQAFHHTSGVVEENLRDNDGPVAAYRDQVSFA